MAADYRIAVRHLKRVDPKLGEVIAAVGLCGLSPTGGRFEIVARSIVSQQISVAAARTIFRRLKASLPGGRISANGLAGLSDDQLQQIGLSRQKRTYLRDLADRTLDGTVRFRRFPRVPDEVVIRELTTVKGIGVWTAQMFLMFGLGRPDVFAPGDLGLQTAMNRLYGSGQPLPATRLTQLADAWAPYRSVACWYLWRSLEMPARQP